MESVVTEPHHFIGHLTDEASNTASQCFGAAVGSDVGRLAELPVDAPYTVGLGMDQDRGARIRRMVEEESWFGWEWQLRADVDDQEPVLVGTSRKVQVEQLA